MTDWKEESEMKEKRTTEKTEKGWRKEGERKEKVNSLVWTSVGGKNKRGVENKW